MVGGLVFETQPTFSSVSIHIIVPDFEVIEAGIPMLVPGCQAFPSVWGAEVTTK